LWVYSRWRPFSIPAGGFSFFNGWMEALVDGCLAGSPRHKGRTNLSLFLHGLLASDSVRLLLRIAFGYRPCVCVFFYRSIILCNKRWENSFPKHPQLRSSNVER
jgi:hypothetical protein